jgi:hypothetical protein
MKQTGPNISAHVHFYGKMTGGTRDGDAMDALKSA